MKALNLIGWITGGIGVILILLGTISELIGKSILAVNHAVNYFHVANSFLLILSGVIIPVTVFPSFIQEIAKLLPITNGLMAVKAAFNGAPLSAVSWDIVREFITGLGYYIIAYFAFIRFEQAVKRTGALERDAE